MSITDHPKLPNKPGHGKYEHVTYDLVSTSPSKLEYAFGNRTAQRFASVRPINKNTYDLPSTKM